MFSGGVAKICVQNFADKAGSICHAISESTINVLGKFLMRVAVLTNFIAPYRVPLLQELQKRTGQMKIFVSTPMEPNRSWAVEWRDLDVEIQKNLTFRRTWKHPKGFKDTLYVHFPYNTLHLLSKYQPDTIVSVEFGLRTLQAVLYCMIFRKTQLIVWAQISESTEQARGTMRHWLRKFITRRMDAVFVNGQSGKRYLKSNFGVPDEKFFFSPYTTNVSAFTSVPLERNESSANRLLYLGQFIERKGIIPFFDVLKQWCIDHPDRQTELWIAGDGPMREQLQNYKWPENIAVKFLNTIQYKDLPDLYASVGLLAFPTLADEWGLVTVEALAAGVPVLGRLYAQSVEEMIVDQKNGWTFYPDRPDTTYEALNSALTVEASTLQTMRLAGRESAIKITPEAVTNMMMEAIEYVHAVRTKHA
ncbi:MAG: glycosyltransferase family 4 protein [Burkholderiaceae bacterium]